MDVEEKKMMVSPPVRFQLPVFVVSAKTFVDRHASIMRQAAYHGLSPDFIWKHDVDELDESACSRVEPNAMPKPSMSCVLKHLEAQKKLLSTSRDVCLVLEDDALLFNDFASKLDETLEAAKKLQGPWLIFLGGTDNRLDKRFFGHNELKLIESPVTTIEAYLINREGCELRMRWLESHLVDKPADHFLKELDIRLGITQYRVSVPFVSQGSITGDFATSLDSSRKNKPGWYLRLRFRWNRYRKQILPRLISRLKAFIIART
jgi:glycosyl transferase, family 25